MTSIESLDRLHLIWELEKFQKVSPFYLTRKRLILKLLGTPAEPNMRVLDVGCGTGDLLPAIAQKGFLIDGLDLSRIALKVAKSRAKKGEVILADVLHIPIRSSYYDMAVCSEVLEHVQEDSEVVREIWRVLKANGRAILTAPHGEEHWTEEDALDGHVRRYSKNRFIRLLRTNGFLIQSIICWGFPIAILFRRFISTPVFRKRLHKRVSYNRASPLVRGLFVLLASFFVMDELFSGFSFGLGIASKVSKVERTHI